MEPSGRRTDTGSKAGDSQRRQRKGMTVCLYSRLPKEKRGDQGEWQPRSEHRAKGEGNGPGTE